MEFDNVAQGSRKGHGKPISGLVADFAVFALSGSFCPD
jgi:hypothetical protein